MRPKFRYQNPPRCSSPLGPESVRGDTNNPTSRASTSITSLQGFRMTAFPEIISAGMNNDSTPQDALWADQLNKVILRAADGVPLGISLDISQVPNVPVGIPGSTMILPKWVEVRAGRSAAISIVAKLVDVHSAFGIRVISLNIIGDSSRRTLGLLLERHDASYGRVSSDDSNWRIYPSVGRASDVQGW